MPTKPELELMNFAQLDALCQALAEEPCSDALTADQARGLRTELERLVDSKELAMPHPVLRGKTIAEARTESLKRRMVSLLAVSL
jgi:hypothetical protein